MKQRLLLYSLFVNAGLLAVLSIQVFLFREEIIQQVIRLTKTTHTAMLGDSHTANGQWSSLLSRPVLKGGAGGSTSKQGLSLLTERVLPFRPKKCLVLFGTNDIAHRGYHLDSTINNYRAIIDTLKRHDIQPVFQSVFYHYQDEAFNQDVDRLDSALVQLCQSEKVQLIDLRPVLCLDRSLRKEYNKDGIHLNKAGYEAWASELRRQLD